MGGSGGPSASSMFTCVFSSCSAASSCPMARWAPSEKVRASPVHGSATQTQVPLAKALLVRSRLTRRKEKGSFQCTFL